MSNDWTKRTLVAAVAIAALAGCANNKKKVAATETSATGQYPPMNQASLDIPAQPPAPAVQYAPPAQPVVYEPPPAASEQPVIADAVADASDSYSPPPRVAAPRRTASAGGTRYKVKKGESLWSIAQTKYGNGNKWKAIAAANPRIDPNRIQAGQTITLP